MTDAVRFVVQLEMHSASPQEADNSLVSRTRFSVAENRYLWVYLNGGFGTLLDACTYPIFLRHYLYTDCVFKRKMIKKAESAKKNAGAPSCGTIEPECKSNKNVQVHDDEDDEEEHAPFPVVHVRVYNRAQKRSFRFYRSLQDYYLAYHRAIMERYKQHHDTGSWQDNKTPIPMPLHRNGMALDNRLCNLFLPSSLPASFVSVPYETNVTDHADNGFHDIEEESKSQNMSTITSQRYDMQINTSQPRQMNNTSFHNIRPAHQYRPPTVQIKETPPSMYSKRTMLDYIVRRLDPSKSHLPLGISHTIATPKKLISSKSFAWTKHDYASTQRAQVSESLKATYPDLQYLRLSEHDEFFISSLTYVPVTGQDAIRHAKRFNVGRFGRDAAFELAVEARKQLLMERFFGDQVREEGTNVIRKEGRWEDEDAVNRRAEFMIIEELCHHRHW
jgi:hypothetical protein